MYTDVKSKLGLSCTFEQFCDGMLLGKKDCTEKYGDAAHKIDSRTGMILTIVLNFMTELEKYINNVDLIYKDMEKKRLSGIFRHLSEVNSVEDFGYFERHFRRFIPSTAISTIPKTGLVEFFS